MDQRLRFWPHVAIPVVAAMGSFSLINFLWNLPALALYEKVPPSLPTYLLSSLVALGVLWPAIRGGRLSRSDLGLASSGGWTPPKRLAGLAIVLFMGFGGYATLPPPFETSTAGADVETLAAPSATGIADDEHPASWPKPSWGDYCFWFVFLLAASLTELLVFVSVTFCLIERFQKQRGTRPWLATTAAALLASITFGLYHYTHPPEFWGYVYNPLMPVMLINLLYFSLTRNFWLTLVLHNGFAAVGFTQLQYAEYPTNVMYNPVTYLSVRELAPVLTSFLVPFLVLHLVEWKCFPANGGEGQTSNIASP
jgi:hypothetical protein